MITIVKIESKEAYWERREQEYNDYSKQIQKIREECHALFLAEELDFQKLDELKLRQDNLEKLRSGLLNSESNGPVINKPIKPAKKQIRSALFQLQFELIIKRDACIFAIEDANSISSTGLVTTYNNLSTSKGCVNSVERRMIKKLHAKIDVAKDLDYFKHCLATTNHEINRLNEEYNNMHKDLFEYGYNSTFMQANHGEDWKTKVSDCIKLDRAAALKLRREFSNSNKHKKN